MLNEKIIKLKVENITLEFGCVLDGEMVKGLNNTIETLRAEKGRLQTEVYKLRNSRNFYKSGYEDLVERIRELAK